MSAQLGCLSEAGSHKAFDERSAWMFITKLRVQTQGNDTEALTRRHMSDPKLVQTQGQ